MLEEHFDLTPERVKESLASMSVQMSVLTLALSPLVPIHCCFEWCGAGGRTVWTNAVGWTFAFG